VAERKKAERLKPKPLPKRKPLTKEELAARPPPKKANKLTPKQRAARKKQRRPKDELARIEKMNEARRQENKVRVNLATFHIFGLERFGPGPCYVPQRLLLAVLEQDRRAVEAEEQLFVERSRIIVKGGQTAGAVALAVANPNFRETWAGENSPIFDQVSGKGMPIGEGARF
jgi:hypothetical protein